MREIRYKKRLPPVRFLYEYYRNFNKKWFGGRLPEDIEIAWDERLDVYGRTFFHGTNKKKCAPVKILIKPPRLDGYVCFKYTMRTLLHEMAHVALGCRVDHGPKFQQEMRRLAAAGAFDGLW